MENNIVFIELDKLYPHKDNPRKEIGDVTELAESIKSRGIMQNLTVIPRAAEEGTYTVIIGHRRMTAAKLAGLKSVPCIITEMSERDQMATMLLENMQRSDLTVYEQAQGFQMMIDLGESIDKISEKTGFSKTTVKRRLKMAELDGEILKEVSSRQLSLADFDELAKIDDIESRNKALKDIGTANFNQAVRSLIKKQNIAKRLPKVREAIKNTGAKKINYSETYGGKYDAFGPTIYFYEWDEETPLFDLSKQNGRKLYYYIDEDWGRVALYVDRPKAAPVKKSQAEIDRDKRMTETRERANEMSNTFRDLRKDFIEKLKVTSSNREAVLKGALISAVLHGVTYVNSATNALLGVADVVNDYKGGVYIEAIKSILAKGDSVSAKAIYATFADTGIYQYHAGSKSEFPWYYNCTTLDALYEWLVLLGYEMSDDEKAYKDGTHEIYKARMEDQSDEQI